MVACQVVAKTPPPNFPNELNAALLYCMRQRFTLYGPSNYPLAATYVAMTKILGQLGLGELGTDSDIAERLRRRIERSGIRSA